MGWRVFRRVRLGPGIRLNLSRSGPSLSVGGRGFSKTLGRRGVRTTVGIPGTGIYHTDVEQWPGSASPEPECSRCHQRVSRTARFCERCGNAV